MAGLPAPVFRFAHATCSASYCLVSSILRAGDNCPQLVPSCLVRTTTWGQLSPACTVLLCPYYDLGTIVPSLYRLASFVVRPGDNCPQLVPSCLVRTYDLGTIVPSLYRLALSVLRPGDNCPQLVPSCLVRTTTWGQLSPACTVLPRPYYDLGNDLVLPSSCTPGQLSPARTASSALRPGDNCPQLVPSCLVRTTTWGQLSPARTRLASFVVRA